MTEPEQPAPRLADERLVAAVESMGAVIVGENAARSVDFELADIPGLAHVKDGRLRVSFFLEFDPEAEDADGFIAENASLPFGLVELTTVAGGTALRFFGERAFDAEPEGDEAAWLARLGDGARTIDASWRQPDGDPGFLHTLAGAGIAAPPGGIALTTEDLVGAAGEEPAGVAALPLSFGPWHWGSTHVTPDELYPFDPEGIARRLLDEGPFFALSHVGCSGNSHALSLVTCAGPVAAFVQHAYGGSMMNPVSSLVELNATYSRLHVLFSAPQVRESAGPLRWLLAYSNLRGTAGLVDLDALRAGAAFEEAWDELRTEEGSAGAESRTFSDLARYLDVDGADVDLGGV